MKIKFAIFIVIFFAFELYWQPSKLQGGVQNEPIGIVKGKVIDYETNKPMEYVSVTIRRSRDSSIVTGSLTAQDGKFELRKIPFGRYYLTFKFVGFKNHIIDSLFVTPKQSIVDIGSIYLEGIEIKTKEVEVTSHKDIVTYSIDKRIYNVDKDLSVVGSSAVDVLGNIPSISVDLDGNVSLRGSGNVTILIDGKPSALLGFDRTSILENIPADNIERIEVITNPSARFDPEGDVGIINIVLKKRLMLGYGGMAQANVGTLDKYMGSFNLNIKTDGLSTNFGYSNRSFRMLGSTKSSMISYFPYTSDLNQIQNFSHRGSYQRFQFSSEWQINDYNSLTAGFSFGGFNRKGSDSAGYLYSTPVDSFINQYYRKNEKETPNNSIDLSLFYKRTFEQREREFGFDLMYTNFAGSSDEYYNQTQYFPDETWQLVQKQNNKTTNKNGNFIAELNYIHPFKLGKLELGSKASIRRIDMDYLFFDFDTISNFWQRNDLISNYFVYQENVFSGYSTFGGKITKAFGYQLGFRAEWTKTKANQKTQNLSFSKNYFNIFPSLHLSYSFNEFNTLMASYTMRINRPSFFALNPFINYSDPQNLSQGNPELNPECANSFEISDLQYIPKGSLNFTLFYRYTTDKITRVTQLIDTNQTLTRYQNLNRSNSLGFEAIWNQSFFDWWKLNLSFSYFYLGINGIPQYQISSRNSRSWNLKLNSVLNITRNVDLQVNFLYESPVVTAGFGDMGFKGGPFFAIGSVGTRQGYYYLNLAMKIDIISDKATINIRLTDVFKSIKYEVTTNSNNFQYQMSRTRESRIAFIGFQYKFNDYKPPKIKQPDEPSEMD